MSVDLCSLILILGAVCLIMQEEFLVEKVPYVLFYSCKLILKTLSLRSRFERKATFKDFLFLWLVCFTKKAVLDIVYYQINWLRYFRYCLLLFVIDYSINLLHKRGISSRSILSIKPVKTFLMLANGICDSISLENLLWRNHINGWHLDAAVFFFVVLDPLFYVVLAWFFKGQKKESNFSPCQRNLNFGVFLSFAHAMFAHEAYSTLIELRRKIPFNSSNVMTPSVGMRLLNCFAYVLFVAYNLTAESGKSQASTVAPVSQPGQKKNKIMETKLQKSEAQIASTIHSQEIRNLK